MTAGTTTYEAGNRPLQDHDEVSVLTDELIRERAYLLEPLLERYVEWIEEAGVETVRSENEYTRDLLTLGVLWRCYGSRAVALPPPFAWLMTGLLRLREVKPAWRANIDRVRAWLAPPLLGPRFGDVDPPGIPSGCALAALLRWMVATGDYQEEVARLHPLCSFLRSRDRLEREWYLAQLSAFSVRFGLMAEHRLRGDILPFGQADAQQKKLDTALHVTRKRIEYHLHAVGVELRYRAAREGDRAPDVIAASC